jgi:hypothetical protein
MSLWEYRKSRFREKEVLAMTLRHTPLSVRVFATTVLLTLGTGYALALLYLYAKEIKPSRDQGIRVVEGVAHTYHGVPGESTLMSALKGSMSSMIEGDDLVTFMEWAADGATEEGYANVAPLVDNNCASCHAADGYPPLVTNYAELKALTAVDEGMDMAALARMTHVHVFGIPLLFYILGALYVRTRYPEKIKAVIIVLPFLGVFLDILHWWLTKASPGFAFGVVISGALMSSGFALQWSMTLWDVWAPAPAGDQRDPMPLLD